MSGVASTVTTFVWRRRSDADAFRSALRGDAVAFSEVYRRYHERVYAFCLSRLLSPDAAHDAAHETFLRLLTAEPDSIRSPESWLFGVARHVCIDVARRDSRITDEPVEDGEAAGARAVSRPAEDEALSQDDARALLLALRRVRPRYRAALILREIHHEPIEVVAESLGVRVGAASTILSRARDAFGRAYAEVLGLENGCREAVGMIYRRTGSGLTSAEETALEAHLVTCAGCRKEAARAGETLSSNAILLLLPVSGGPARGILARALELVARDQSLVHALSVGGSVVEAPATRVATTVVAAVIALTVGLSGVSPGPPAPAPGTAGGSDSAASAGRQAAASPSDTVSASSATPGCDDGARSGAQSAEADRLLRLSAHSESPEAGMLLAGAQHVEAGSISFSYDGESAALGTGGHAEAGTGGVTAGSTVAPGGVQGEATTGGGSTAGGEGGAGTTGDAGGGCTGGGETQGGDAGGSHGG